ncbi:unnamed protein product [Brassicogethes aeneus]|uniref:BEN domain-containing protein n=1 Tax=Brassicogethes aeneus TaxID=1431903 RepID=A0A9P0FAS5_BRAAE|nr:unnamed protein product [Brassicogethes aeneus]
MMWFLVFFKVSKKSCVVKGVHLSKQNPAINDIVDVDYGNGKIYAAKILRKSNNKTYLESLGVSTTGEVVTPTLAENNPRAHQRKIKFNPIPKTKKVSHIDEFIEPELLEDDDDQMGEAFKDYKNNNDETENTFEKEEKSESNKNLTCKMCENIQITPEIILLQEHFFTHLTERYRDQMKQKKGSKKDKELKELEHWQIPSYSKVELVDNSGVWIEHLHLKQFEGTVGETDYREMIRKLLRELVGDKKLANSCALGHSFDGASSAINPQILKTIKEYTQDKYKNWTNTRDFNRIVNLFCGRIRFSLKDGKTSTKRFLAKSSKKPKEHPNYVMKSAVAHPQASSSQYPPSSEGISYAMKSALSEAHPQAQPHCTNSSQYPPSSEGISYAMKSALSEVHPQAQPHCTNSSQYPPSSEGISYAMKSALSEVHPQASSSVAMAQPQWNYYKPQSSDWSQYPPSLEGINYARKSPPSEGHPQSSPSADLSVAMAQPQCTNSSPPSSEDLKRVFGNIRFGTEEYFLEYSVD